MNDRVTHVAVCLEENNMIEAGGGGEKTKTVEIARKQNAKSKKRKCVLGQSIGAKIGWLLCYPNICLGYKT